jgi:hypothetical protein
VRHGRVRRFDECFVLADQFEAPSEPAAGVEGEGADVALGGWSGRRAGEAVAADPPDFIKDQVVDELQARPLRQEFQPRRYGLKDQTVSELLAGTHGFSLGGGETSEEAGAGFGREAARSRR